LYLGGAASAAAFTATPGVVFADDTPLHCAPPKSYGPASEWKSDSRPIEERLAASTLSASYLTKLRDAYKAMRALPAGDPRCFQQQANIHGWWCGGCGDGKMAPGGGIHYHWTFFLWHRAYLYFHERILGKLIGDDNFRLPYWEWDNTSYLTMPPGYTSPANSSNSLWNSTRVLGPSEKLDAASVGPATMNPIYAIGSWDPFGGSTNSGGAVEDGPHGFVHVSVGGDMGAFATAGMDPIFYAHHANVDRIWAYWQDSLHKPDAPSSYFGSTKWPFFDENKKLWTITPADVIDHENKLRYTYVKRLTLRPFPFPIRIPPWELAATGPQIRITADQQKAVLSAKAQGGKIGIALQGIPIPDGVSGVLDITTVVDGKPEKVGYVAIVPDSAGGMTMANARVSTVVEVTSIAEHVLAPTSTAEFRLRPRSTSAAPTSFRLTAARAQLVVY
jgi:hypothetical protein